MRNLDIPSMILIPENYFILLFTKYCSIFFILNNSYKLISQDSTVLINNSHNYNYLRVPLYIYIDEIAKNGHKRLLIYLFYCFCEYERKIYLMQDS